MRIAIDAMILGRRDSGVGVWTRGLVRALARWGGEHEYLVYHGRDAAELPALASPRACYVPVPVPNGVRPLRIAWEQVKLPARLRRDGVDVLHCPAYVRPLRVDRPTVLTLHDLFAFTHPRFCRRLNALHYRLTIPPGLRRATVIHCTSQWVRQTLERQFPSEAGRARVVHPGVDGLFRPDAEPAALDSLGLDAPPFLFVGKLEPKKDVATLLDAYELLRRRFGTDRRLLLVGGAGWGTRRVTARLRSGELAAHVVRAGYVPRGALPGIYRAALVLVFPSLCEGFGLPPLEAAACGTPVICSSVGGLAESAGGSALAVPPGDPAALAEAMHRVETSGELRERLARAGLERAAAFAWRDKAAQMVHLYELAASQAGQ